MILKETIKGYTSFIDNDTKLKETDVIYLKAYFERANANRKTLEFDYKLFGLGLCC